MQKLPIGPFSLYTQSHFFPYFRHSGAHTVSAAESIHPASKEPVRKVDLQTDI